MKYIPERYEDIAKLAQWLKNDEITIDEYYEACNEFSKIIVDKELKYPQV